MWFPFNNRAGNKGWKLRIKTWDKDMSGGFVYKHQPYQSRFKEVELKNQNVVTVEWRCWMTI